MTAGLLLLFALLGCAQAGPGGSAPARPNVVFVLADDLGWSDTTLYGGTELYRTPNLERLARHGMTFTHAYAASSVCSPTRASLVTGLSPARLGITAAVCHDPHVLLEPSRVARAPAELSVLPVVSATRLKGEYVTLAEALKQAGYATGHFGKWHLGAEPYSPLQQGFDVDVPHWSGSGPAGSYMAPWQFPDFAPKAPEEHLEDRMAQEAVAFLEAHRDEPFFLQYWMFSVHPPFDAKKALVERYRERVDPSDAQRSPTYAAMVESLDDGLGTVLDALERLDLMEKTIVVFFSDNGGNAFDELDGTTPTSNRPLRGGKGTIWEGGLRVPCIVTWPGRVPGGSRSDAVVQSTDFYPTLLEMLGLAPQPGQRFDGISFAPALRGEPLEREAIFTYLPQGARIRDWLPPCIAVTRGDWKLIRIFHGGAEGAHRWKLFDLRQDPGETQDLAAREPERVRALDDLIQRYLSDTQALVPLPNPRFDPAAVDPEEEGQAAPGEGTEESAGLRQGWRARHGRVAVEDGILTLRGSRKNPFLALELEPEEGPLVIRLRARCAEAGVGAIEGLPPEEDDSPGAWPAVPLSLAAGDWQVLEATLVGKGPLGGLRLHLPAESQAVEVDWIELAWPGHVRRFEF